MTLLPYTLTAEHVNWPTLKDADALSPAPTEQQSHEDQIAEQEIINQVNSVVQTMPGTNKKLNDIVTSPDMIKNFWTIARSYAEGMATFHQRLP